MKKIIKEINDNKNFLKISYKNDKVFNQLLDELNQKWDIFENDPLTKAIKSGRDSIAHMRELKTVHSDHCANKKLPVVSFYA